MNAGFKKHQPGIVILLVAGALAALIINQADRFTRESIEANRNAYELGMITKVLPAGGYDNEPRSDVIWLSDADLPGSGTALPAYRARLGDELVATALTAVADDGYVGPVRLLVGIGAEGSIIRVQPLEHRETPGLGDKLEPEKSDWIKQFAGLAPAKDARDSRWALRRDGGDLDQISGATITSRAVIRAVRQTQLYYLANTEKISAPSQPKD